MTTTNQQMDQRFLGREFLTWLIYHADDENGGGRFCSPDFEGGDEFLIQPGERVVLRALGEGAGEITVRGAAPAQTPDVRYAIAGGLTVQEADVLISRGDRTFQLAVHAEHFDLKRAKLPELLSRDDEERALERLGLLDELDAMLKAAFGVFLSERMKPAWDRDLVPRIRTWLAHSCLTEDAAERATGRPD